VLLNHQETKFRVYYLGVSRFGCMGLQADFRADRKCIKTLAHTIFVPIVCRP
jgi:hypothetical protein